MAASRDGLRRWARQLGALLTLRALVKRRSAASSAAELLAPVAVAAVLVWVRTQVRAFPEDPLLCCCVTFFQCLARAWPRSLLCTGQL